jgi:hypothetical protein
MGFEQRLSSVRALEQPGVQLGVSRAYRVLLKGLEVALRAEGSVSCERGLCQLRPSWVALVTRFSVANQRTTMFASSVAW